MFGISCDPFKFCCAAALMFLSKILQIAIHFQTQEDIEGFSDKMSHKNHAFHFKHSTKLHHV